MTIRSAAATVICRPASRLYSPPRAVSSSWLPASVRPASSTTIRSPVRTVDRRGAMTMIETRTGEDGADLGPWLAQLFEVLDTPEDERAATLDEDLARLPYFDGDLFEGHLPSL